MRPQPVWLHRAAAVVVFGGALCLTTTHALAGELSPAEKKLWKEMLKEGIAAQKDERCADAIDVLKQVAAIRETSEVMLHLGECLVQTGALNEGLKSWERAEDLARVEKSKAMQRTLSAKLGDLRERIPTVLLQIPSDAPHPAVKIDGEPVSAERVASPIQLDPGEHSFEVTADGRLPFSKKLKLSEKDSTVIPVALPSDKPPEPPPSSSHIPLGTWIAGSAALVLAAGGAAAFVVAGDMASDGETQCATRPSCDQKSIDSVRQLDAAALGLWIGAGVGAGLAVTLWAIDRPTARSAPTTGLQKSPSSLRATRVVVGPAALRIEGSF